MRRRHLAAMLAALAAPQTVRAQQAKVPVIGYLGSGTAGQFERRLAAFHQGLRTTGFEPGRNVAIEYRWADGHNDRLPALAADLVRQGVNLIAAPGNLGSTLAAQRATTAIPIVFEIGTDPVAFGLVASLSRPGGNVTGVTSLSNELGAKQLELLHELAPALTDVGFLINPTNPNAGPATPRIRTAAAARGIGLHILHASGDQDLHSVVVRLVERMGTAGLVIGADQFFATRSRELAALTVRLAVPAIHFTREFPEAGGLLNYGGVFAETHRQAGVYAGRILKGENPADLAVQQATKFEMVINLATAKVLRLTVPPALLARADEVIE